MKLQQNRISLFRMKCSMKRNLKKYRHKKAGRFLPAFETAIE